jgi:hypothetical protein
MKQPISKVKVNALNSLTEAARAWLDKLVCVVAVVKNNQIVDHATGTRIQWGDGRYILTAGHFAEQYTPEEITVYARTASYSVPLRVAGIQFVNRGREDVALLKVSDEDSWPKEYQVVPESMICDVEPSVLAQSPFIIVGYPDGFKRQENKLDYDFASLCYSYAIEPPSLWHATTKRDIEFELDWPTVIYNPLVETRHFLPHGKDLAGLSGAAVWLSCINDSPIWTPQHMKLVGIFREYHSERLKAYATLPKTLRLLTS